MTFCHMLAQDFLILYPSGMLIEIQDSISRFMESELKEVGLLSARYPKRFFSTQTLKNLLQS